MASYTMTTGQKISGFTVRRMGEIRGTAWALLAVFLLLAILSYEPSDPSLNFVANGDAQNWMGAPGAIASDFLLQTFGLASLLFSFAFLAWAWRSVTHTTNSRLPVRLMLVIAAATLGALLLAFVPTPMSWPIDTGLGGAIGTLLRVRLIAFLPDPVVALFALLLTMITVPWALGLNRGEWLGIGHGIVWSGQKATAAVSRFLPERAERDEDEDEEETVRFARLRRAGYWLRAFAGWHGNDDEEEADEAEEEKPAARRRSRKKVDDDEEIEFVKPVAKPVSRVAKPVAKEKQQQALQFSRKEGAYQLPGLELLKQVKRTDRTKLSESALEQNARLLESVLADFGVKGEIANISPGPVVTLYELEPAAGTKSSRVIGLADDIARSMSAVSARISVIPGRNAIGIELPNSKREMVNFRELIEDDEFGKTDVKLPLALGKDIGGTPIVVDLSRMPHLLVAGTTGSGKSVAINTMITSLLYHLTPDECRFIMVDPKMLELSVYEGIPHLLAPVVTEPGKAVVALKWVVKEMENRYRLMSALGVRNIDGYNKRIKQAAAKGEELKRTVQTGFDPETGKPIYEDQPLEMVSLPFIVVIVDEMADLMLVAGKDIEGSIQRLAQMARAAGIHLIMATQRPSVDVITGVIKANFPTRISFQVTSRIDSRTILGEQGAEQLLGQGDMLYMAGGGRITRVHGPFISDPEVEEIVSYLRTQGAPSYVEEVTIEPEEMESGFDADASDEESALYQKAVGIVRRDGKASTSYIQRCLKIGYNRAARLIDQMEKEGIVSAANHVGKREIIG